MANSTAAEKKFTKAEKSWIMYDWANSVYATNMMAAIFPIFFGIVCNQAGLDKGANTILLSTCASITNLIVAILAPILGALGDHKGYKKKLFAAFMILGVAFTLSTAFFIDYKLLMVGYTLSHIGFSGSCLFYDSFLTDVTTNERMDRVSSWGYAMGYIGGSTIPFVASIVILFLMGFENVFAFQLVMILTSVWWLVFSIPTLLNVKQTHYIEDQKDLVRSSLSNLWSTAKDIFKNKKIFLFIVAYFFYIDGVGTVISVSTSYGTTLGLNSVGMVLALLVTQIVAVPCSILFGKLSNKVGSIKLLLIAVAVYVGICCVGFYMGFSLEGPQQVAEANYHTAFDTAIQNVQSQEELEALKELRTEGLSVVNKKDRSGLFAEKVDEAKGVSESTKAALKASVIPTLNDITDLGDYDRALGRSNILFWCMAFMVGTVQGGIQAISRSYFGKLIPAERSNEFFGFFDIFGKFAAVVGPALMAFFTLLTGRASVGIISLILLFATGFILLMVMRKRFPEAA